MTGAFAATPPCRRIPGRLTPERFSFPGLGGAAGGDGVSLLGDPESSAGEANLLTRLSTEGLLGSGSSAQVLDLMLEFRCGVGGGFFPPGLDVLLVFLPGDPLLSGAGEAVGESVMPWVLITGRIWFPITVAMIWPWAFVRSWGVIGCT